MAWYWASCYFAAFSFDGRGREHEQLVRVCCNSGGNLYLDFSWSNLGFSVLRSCCFVGVNDRIFGIAG